MKSLFNLLFSVLLASTPATAAMLPAGTAGHPGQPAQGVPIRIVGAGVVAGNPTAPGGAPFTASGVATHLGTYSNSGVLAIDPVTWAATGRVTFVAANGDRLDATFDGVFDPATGTARATFHWGGGTGRFAQATGDARFVVRQDPSGAFSFTAAGTLVL